MTKAKKAAKTLWIARQAKGHYDEYRVYVGKRKPRFEVTHNYLGEVGGVRLADYGQVEMCAEGFHRATDIRLERGEIAQIRVSLVGKPSR